LVRRGRRPERGVDLDLQPFSEFSVIISQVGRIKAPTLLISGRYDEATPAVVQPFFDGIAGARWEIFEQSSHMPHVEEQERCLEIIRNFLAEHDTPALRSVKTIQEKRPRGEKRRHR